MWEVLQPVRQLRPVHGGLGWSEDVAMQLRALNLDVTDD